MIPYGRHKIFPEDITAVSEVLKEGFLTQGEQVPLFEKAVCDYTGANFAVACNSGTSGLHAACLAAGITTGDLVWTVPNSFVASANCARYCGADIDFIDIDPKTRNLCVAKLFEKLQLAVAVNKLPKAIVVVHFAGSSCDMAAISSLTTQYGIVLIEDAAHALGGADQYGNKVGLCKYSAMTVFSFHPVKSITSAEGGMVLTNDEATATLLRRYISHGICRDNTLFDDNHKGEPWYYAQFELGFNYRLSDIHAALGRSQLKHLDDFVLSRFTLAKRYDELLEGLPIVRPILDAKSAWHLYMIEVSDKQRTSVFNLLRERGIGVNVHYIPIHLQPYYQRLGFVPKMFPNAESYYKRAVTLPLFPSLTSEQQDEVVRQLHEAIL
ncbi:UDP-4-amino-4, 6-dideoxy-N-acetyl-beta-L-altrosamine transaminase [Alteromonas sp. 38]|uniref:UDP-4-amino-4, 6-dideoxy-N-acetyl-beta-L-altrosamine transaminase n=1 Tax=Alteromonas TaxID=226 RepID=UPI0012F3D4DC|nr:MULTISPECIES: UDP-4-amino-4,6-dideoxy-N-acetyl-beta-L-altrosamine transaminase [Alteromonas]CAD5285963.1 UDP-4-amino-4, 6-dideoxy-N-acetyl-beta-L-altrosamine transaminase [Alteromonas sp. 154]VXB35533.1 UDP-4-amino-4, 6-dideoxy-N-acetyl-beta-L-altrosamine transaminase [Alteromonas sp. 38]